MEIDFLKQSLHAVSNQVFIKSGFEMPLINIVGGKWALRSQFWVEGKKLFNNFLGFGLIPKKWEYFADGIGQDVPILIFLVIFSYSSPFTGNYLLTFFLFFSPIIPF